MGDLEWVDLSSVNDDQLSQGTGGSWTVKPDGWYRVMACEGVVKDASSGSGGKVIHVKFAHLDPRFSNSHEMAFLNVAHPKEKVQEIGRAQLKSWAIATGHTDPSNVKDTSELLNRPFMLKLYSKKEGGKYADANGMVQKIGGYLSTDEHAKLDADEPDPVASNAPHPSGMQEPASFAEDVPW